MTDTAAQDQSAVRHEPVEGESVGRESAHDGSSRPSAHTAPFAHTAPGRRDFAAGEQGRGPDVPSPLTNNPRAGQWDGRTISRSIVADYKRFVVTDGEGIRCSLYVSGCPFHCKGCWNASIWDFQAGHPYTQALEDQIIKDLGESYVQGITFLGGEPMLNTPVLVPLARRIRHEFGRSKDIWCWTGYTWEELMRPGETPDKLELLRLSDVLVDGRFIETKKNLLLQFRGSSNQRVIDVPRSLDAGRPVIWLRLHDQHRFVPSLYGKDRAVEQQA